MSAIKTHGCYSKDATSSQKHTLMCWANMLRRCYDSSCLSFPDYGGRGVAVCDRWKVFSNFLEDMGEKPSGLTLERMDNHKGYSKANCCWASYEEQNKNRRLRCDNKFGAAGIYFKPRRNKYEARIFVNKKTIFLGQFAVLSDAVKARKQAEKVYGFRC